ncbi:hypothetical protein ACPCTO_32015 [Streptomyces olivoreticuli]
MEDPRMRLPRILYGQPQWVIDLFIGLAVIGAAIGTVLFLLL